MNNRWTRWNIILLSLVMLIGLGIRLFDLFEPPLDFHPVRQLRSAVIARNFYYQMSPNISEEMRQTALRSVPNEVLEPPIFEAIVSGTYLLAGGEYLWLARAWAILFWMIGGLALFLILRRYFSFPVSLLSLAFYLFLPFAIQASRAFQPDPFMVMWILLSILALIRWTEKPTWLRAVVAGLIGGATILVKVTAGLFLAGTYAAIILFALGWKPTLRNLQVYAIAALTLLPTIIYYLLLNSGNSAGYFSFWTVSMSGMLLTSKFYLQWLTMIDSLISLTMLIAALLGSLLAPPRFKPVLIGLWIGYIAYGLLWPFQYTTHNYYHLMLVPIIALGLAGLLETILQRLNDSKLRWVALGIFVAMSAFSLWAARSEMLVSDYSNEPESWRRVGVAIPVETHFAALVNDYGVRLAYYGMRNADIYWPNSGDLQVQELRGVSIADYRAYFENNVVGVDLFLVAAFNELENQPDLKQILSGYQVFYEGNGFILYDLTKPVQ
ncbi:MAG TPA: glycosyltransferase family 39 protein [Anaerolineaceae bacterium]|nr:glycosyltransferase family 39 protein [Anaerolineaceae bacterium]